MLCTTATNTSNTIRTGKWSDGDQWVQETTEVRNYTIFKLPTLHTVDRFINEG